MPSFEQQFTDKGFKVLQRCTLEKPPANARERAEAAAGKLGVASEQIVKAMALRTKPNGDPLLLLLPTAERLDLGLVSRLLKQEAEYFPQEQIEAAFGAPMNALSLLAAPSRQIPIAADGRLFDQEQVVIASGDPLVELLVDATELRAFLGEDRITILDFESAKSRKGEVIEPRTLKGFRDYLPEEMLPRQAMIDAITVVFERFGFVPLQTPALEYSDILLGKMGADAEKLLFRFRDNGGRDVSMRYDLTVPLARVAAQYPELPKPFKRYQIAPVWRGENPGRGRFREFFQCDCDIVGSSSLLYDAECVALGFAVMQALGANVEVRFSNRKVLAALGSVLSLADERQMMIVSRTIDKIPAQGKERVRELLKTDAGCAAEQIERIMRFVEIAGSNEQMLDALKEQLGPAA
jgi:prolyl-tRNA editing enzyme YbaK/EbsC (Cys-tRNA(Pro) deacylase)